MTTVAIILVITTLLYLLWRNEQQGKLPDPGRSGNRWYLWVLIGLLSAAALLSPGIRERIKDLWKKT
jgi:4-amino-4-deoxy-L-arabinose transferase-like glycosyltransferase